MRKALSLLIPAMLLAGCGANPTAIAPAGQARTATAAALATSANAPFSQVFYDEPLGFEQIEAAASRFCAQNNVCLPLGPNGEIERVTQIMLEDAAGRPAANGGREVVGTITFMGVHVPDTYLTHQKLLPFRMTLSATQKVLSFDYENVNLKGLTIVKPTFQPVSAADHDRFQAAIMAYWKPKITKPNHDVISALFGFDDDHVSTISDIKATAGAFGEHARVLSITIQYRRKDGQPYDQGDFGFNVLLDAQGRVTGWN